MADTNAVGGLKWVKDEIFASLQRVRGLLEDFVERGKDPDQSNLNEAISTLGEVRGVLSALQLDEPARLAQEMQGLCEDLAARSVSNTHEASDALMLALAQLPDYLDRVGAGRTDVALSLLPSINDLRISHNAGPISSAELLAPESVVTHSDLPPPQVLSSLRHSATRLRPNYHLYLLKWLQEKTPRQGLAELSALFQELQAQSGEGVFHDLFLGAAAIVDAVADGIIAEDARSKALIAHMDRIIRPLATEQMPWPTSEARRQLFELLSALVTDAPPSHQIAGLLASYGLTKHVDGKEDGSAASFSAGPAPEAFRMLVAAARKELASIKDTLDLFSRGDREDREQLLRLEPQLNSLANTLSATGASDLADRLQRCGGDLQAMGQGDVATDDLHLIAVAEELLAVEVALGDLGMGEGAKAGREEIRELLSSALREIRVDVAKAERAVNELVAAPRGRLAFNEVADLFRRVIGALRVLSENDAAQIFELVLEQLERRFWQTAQIPREAELDLLAQAVSGVDLYIAGMSEGEPYSAELLTDARRAIDELRTGPSLAKTQLAEEQHSEAEEPGAEEVEGEEAETSTTGLDPDFLDIFLEEAREEERKIGDQFARWRQDKSDDGALAELRRSFHTLKGSGRLVGAMRVGELASVVEMLLNDVSEHTLTATPEIMAFVGEAVDLLPDLVTAETEQQPLDVSGYIARAKSLATVIAAEEEEELEFPAEKPDGSKVIPWPAAAPTFPPTAAPEESAATPQREPSVLAPVEVGAQADIGPEDSEEIAALATADAELLGIFRSEAREHLQVLRSYLEGIEEEGASPIPNESVTRALHTLTGSARMTGVQSTAGATAPLERLFLAHRAQGTKPESSLLQLLGQTISATEERLEHLPGYGDEMPALRRLSEDLQARLEIPKHKEEAQMPSTQEERLPEVVEQAASDEEVPAAEPTEETAKHKEVAVEISEPAATEEPLAEEPAPLGQFAPEARSVDREVPSVAKAQPVAPPPQDAELVNLFLEDARDIIDRLDRSLRDLRRAPTESEPREAMQRSLHTLKGSARLSGLTPIGDLSHALESLLIAVSRGEVGLADDRLELAQRTMDTLADQIDAVERGLYLRPVDDLVQTLMSLSVGEGLAGAADLTPAIATTIPSAKKEEPATEARGAAAVAAPQIRVRADLIDRLVNSAGEISIYRSRLAQQGSLMTFRLGELDHTVDRLRAQLRKLEIETEAQILYRYERDAEHRAPGEEQFDPLELDRFSTLQQLSRGLAETVNDLVSLRTLLRDLQSDSDTLLQQQERISGDLQDGLLRTRMVPFVQSVPRLQRLVRQTAQQMGKEARLEVFGSDVEVDRSIQEQILAPLEHLLRNAVAHGIEPPEERKLAGKSASGVISLTLNREGNDVVITVADDGSGLDLEAIRERAVERGVVDGSSPVGDEVLTGLILESGFSTAKEVSQIAGRGVGLDVVNTEVKQLSGTFGLESQSGQGTKFTIRLPLTLAIIDALLVQLGDQVYAIPHATVEAVSRISRSELDACYRGAGNDFSYGGHDFRVMYLASMLQLNAAPDLGELSRLPVLLVRSGEQRIAFPVDQLLGMERIVVKPLGPELSDIRFLSGGTILPDGRVAMILDPLALARTVAVHDTRAPMPSQPEEHKRRPFVMVVDDSLTVRRVTSRMLRRQNMDVVTAQDGIDALTRLEERVPDVLLLDIEMPRMDGYELTRHIRRSERLKRIPIIMITSRTGEKHRAHALELGVDRYLGKPYQETDLLDEISSLLVEASL
jgi:chemosensory pili system protein ChpA (sensor histidine kinase/response regulator)